MARIARCEVTEEGCDNPRCKISACILASEERQAAEAAAATRRAQVREIAIEVVDAVFKATRRRAATSSELTEWLAMPAVQNEAERRMQWREGNARSKLGILGL